MRKIFKNKKSLLFKSLNIGFSLTFCLGLLLSSCGEDHISPKKLKKEIFPKTFANQELKPPKEPSGGGGN